MSVVRLESINDDIVYISDIDVVDGTPLLDIKPYVPHFDRNKEDEITIGWFENKHHEAVDKRSDGRFLDK